MSTVALLVDLSDLEPPTPRFKTHHKSQAWTWSPTRPRTHSPHFIPETIASAPSPTQTKWDHQAPAASPPTHTPRVRTKSHGHLTRADASAALALSAQRAEANLYGGRLASGGSSDTEKKGTLPLAKSFPLHLSASVTVAPPVPKNDPKHLQTSSSSSGKPRPRQGGSVGVSGGGSKRTASPGALRRKAPTPPAIPSKSKKPSAMSAHGDAVSKAAVSGRGMEPNPTRFRRLRFLSRSRSRAPVLEQDCKG